MFRYYQLIIGFFGLLLVGVAYAWSLFVAPLELEFGWTRDETSLVFTIEITCFCLGGIVGSIVNRRIGHRKTFIIAAILITAGFFGGSITTSLMQMYACYGVLCGTAIGIVYNVIISTVNSWFMGKVGFSSGVMLMGYGLGSFVLGVFISRSNELFGWRITFVILAIITGVTALAMALLLKVNNTNTLTDSANDKSEHISKNVVSNDTPCDKYADNSSVSTSQMLRRGDFYAFYIWSLVITAIGLGVIGHASMMAADLGAAGTMLAVATGTITVTNGISRMIVGFMFDKLGRKLTMLIDSTVDLAAIIMLCIAFQIGSFQLLMVSFVLFGFGYGGLAPCNSAFARTQYGDKYYGSNFGVITSSGMPASIVGPYIIGIVIAANGNYKFAAPMLLIFYVAAFICERFLSHKSNQQN